MGGFVTLRLMLLERDGELGLMADLLANVDSAGGKVILLRGEAGIGKSSLITEFAERNADETHLLFGSCDDLLTPQPLGPFWDFAREEPSLAEPLENGDRPGVLAATLDLLSRAPHANSEWSSIRGAYIRDLNGCRHIPADSGNNRSKRFKIRERTILEGLIHSREGPVWVLNGDLYRCP